MKYLGLSNANINFNSSLHACPDTCISESALYTTFAPRLLNLLITPYIVFSFPGIAEELNRTQSRSEILTFLKSSLLILVNALRGSPCVPVLIIHNLS